MRPIPTHWVTIDPGDKHVGFAVWVDHECVSAVELDPRGAENRLIELMGSASIPELVIIERWSLYPQLARQQAGSEMLTSQLIGALKLICRLKGVPVETPTAASGKRAYSFEPWRSWPQRRWASYGHGGHARDAEVHGHTWLWKECGFVPES